MQKSCDIFLPKQKNKENYIDRRKQVEKLDFCRGCKVAFNLTPNQTYHQF